MRAISAFIACAFLTALQTAQAQAPPRLEFEVASIKPSPPQAADHTSTNMSTRTTTDGRNGTLSFTNVSVTQVLEQAYKVQPYQISGGPSWIGSDRFDITAVIPAATSRDQIDLMLQNLLADRFQLTVHRETKPLPEYALTVGKSGLKMKPAETGNNDITSNSSRMRWHVTAKATVPRLAEFLSEQLGRPVVDETGLNGSYEMTLDWSGDSADQPAADAPPSLFTAVQEQLGLKLESRRGPVEVIVVDRLEKPSEN